MKKFLKNWSIIIEDMDQNLDSLPQATCLSLFSLVPFLISYLSILFYNNSFPFPSNISMLNSLKTLVLSDVRGTQLQKMTFLHLSYFYITSSCIYVYCTFIVAICSVLHSSKFVFLLLIVFVIEGAQRVHISAK